MRKIRVTFHDAERPGNLVSIWVHAKDDTANNAVLLTLLHSYPDWQPKIGMFVKQRGKQWEVIAVNDQTVTCI